MSWEDIKRHKQQKLDASIKELELLADNNKDRTHYLSEEAFKLGIKYAIREIEETETITTLAHNELKGFYISEKDGEREYQNTKNLLGCLKTQLINRYKGVIFDV